MDYAPVNIFQGLLDIFSSRKFVRSPVLNRLGAQVVRAAVAEAWLRLRRFARYPSLTPEQKRFVDDGLIVVPNFLSPSDFERLRIEFERVFATPHLHEVHHLGQTLQKESTPAATDPAGSPILKTIVSDARLLKLFSVGEGRPVGAPHCAFEIIEHGPQDIKASRDEDPNLVHCDVFFATHKGWIFLEDVSMEDGPFCFLKGSQKITLKRLLFEYRRTNDGCADRGSWRLNEEEKRYFGLETFRATIPANTLIIANTCGFHNRSDGMPGRTRKALRFQVRSNPFAF
jgi:hypothetical protein